VKILKPGRLSLRDDSEWIVGKWRKEPDAPKNGKACDVGLHSIICDDPLKSPVFSFPCVIWEDECRDECGRDEVKARYREQRITRQITSRFPIIVKINAFVRSISSVQWFKPQKPAPYMKIERYESLAAARAAAWDAARAAAWDAMKSKHRRRLLSMIHAKKRNP